MTEYRIGRKRVSYGKDNTLNPDWKTVNIPDEAEYVEVEYTEPAGMDKPKLEAKIMYLLPVEELNDD